MRIKLCTVVCLLVCFITLQILYSPPVFAATPISCGTITTGTIGTSGEQDEYTFDAESGDAVTIRLTKTSGDMEPYLVLSHPQQGTTPGNTSDNYAWIDKTGLMEGTYTIRVSDQDGDETGAYSLVWQKTNNPCNATALSCGETFTHSCSGCHTVQHDFYTFNANAEDAVTVRAVSTADLNLNIEIYKPSGEKIDEETQHQGNYGHIDTPLPDQGQYTLVVSENDHFVTGGYRLNWNRVNYSSNCSSCHCYGCNQTELTCGETVSSSLSIVGAQRFYFYSASQGENVTIRLITTSGEMKPYLELYNVEGTMIAYNTPSSGNLAQIDTTFDTTGLYTIVVYDDGNDNTGNYNLTLQRFNYPCNATPLICGTVSTGTLGTTGEQKFYTITANAGDEVTIQLIRTSGAMTPNLELYDSTGQIISSNTSTPTTGNSAEINKTFSTRGTYTLVVLDNGNNDTGDYNLTMQRWNIPCSLPTLTCGQTKSSSLSIGEQNIYTFTANTGDNVVLTLTRTSGDLDPGLDVYDSSGNMIDSDHPESGGTATLTLSDLNGTYFAVVSDTGNDESGDYTLNLKNLRVTVTKPNGGEFVGGTSILKITWDSGNSQCISSQDIYLSTNGGSSFTPIATNLTADVQSYDWTVPDNLSTSNARIRVKVFDAAGNSVQDESDTTFTIHTPTTITGDTTISTNTTWDSGHSPYIISGNISILSPTTTPKLTITTTNSVNGSQGPVEIRFAEGKGIKVGGGTLYTKEYGVLNAVGTKGYPITFTTNIPGTYWSGIIFKWGANGKDSQGNTNNLMKYCTIEYAGYPRDRDDYGENNDGALCFWLCVPANYSIANCTIRYSMTDGIRINDPDNTLQSPINQSNIYGNARYDFLNYDNDVNSYIYFNYWGTPNGPSKDNLCFPSVIKSKITIDSSNYEPWLAEEFRDLKFNSLTSADPPNPPVGQGTNIHYHLTAQANEVKVSIENEQFETLWSTTCTNTITGTIQWNGTASYGGKVSGNCYYRVEATSATLGDAAPAMGHLTIGTQPLALITEPFSQSLYSAGIDIPIVGTAIIGSGGNYDVRYGIGENPGSWNYIVQNITSPKENQLLATWHTTGLDPNTTYTIRLDVRNGNNTYTDRVTVKFIFEQPETSQGSKVTYTYDELRRLIGITYPDASPGSSIVYTYDKVGNRQTVATTKRNQSPRRPIRLAYFKAKPTRKGVLLAWKTGSNVNASGFNLYRKGSEEGSYEKVNSSLIRAKGDGASGSEYSLIDAPPKMSEIWYYQLEIVEATGKTRRYGPIQSRNFAIGGTNYKEGFQKSFNVNCD